MGEMRLFSNSQNSNKKPGDVKKFSQNWLALYKSIDETCLLMPRKEFLHKNLPKIKNPREICYNTKVMKKFSNEQHRK